MKQLTEEQAIELAKTGWWRTKVARDIALFQMQQDRLCMDFSAFHKAVEEALNRPVYTHEFAFKDRLWLELIRENSAPTFEDIINLIPKEKRIVLGGEK